jgi:hypothetical protein
MPTGNDDPCCHAEKSLVVFYVLQDVYRDE